MASPITAVKYHSTKSDGTDNAGGKIYTYAAGTTTPQATYSDPAGLTPNSNPIILDGTGRAFIYLNDSLSYKFVCQDSAGASVPDGTVDNWANPAGSLRSDLANTSDATKGAALIGRGAQVVDSISALRGLSKASASNKAFVAGYYAAGDGGGGLYYYDSSDTTSADNGGTIIVAFDGGRWKLVYDGRVSVKQFGAKGDGTTDDRLAIKTTITTVNTLGGGEVLFPHGTYLVSSTEGVFSLPDLDTPTIQWTTANYDVQIRLTGISNIVFRFEGSSIVSNKTNGGYVLLFDGFNNITFENLQMTGATVMSGSTVVTVGTNAIGLLSQTQNSSNATFRNPKFANHYAGIDIVGNPASGFRVTNVKLNGAVSFSTGYYGILCRGNGVGVEVQGGYAGFLNRPFFIYDTNNVSVKLQCDNINGGFQALIKAYTVNVRNITVDMYVTNRANAQACLGLQSQHNPALQPVPCYLKNVSVRYTDNAAVAGGDSIRFSYYQLAVLTATSNQLLFTEIDIEGSSAGGVASDVTLTAVANRCVLRMTYMDAFQREAIYGGGSGFVPAKVATWTPADLSGAGLVFTISNGQYNITDTVSGTFSVSYPANASAAAASFSGPPIPTYPTPQDAQAVTVSYNDSGLNLIGCINANTSTISWRTTAGAVITNSQLSGKTIRGSFNFLP